LRRAFQRWGRPQRIRVDNGVPWGSSGDLPTDLALWLIGLGIEVIWNPPRCPQHNGVVERAQGTGKRWAEPQTCANAQELQQRLNTLDRLQREAYPSVGGCSRQAAFPQLAHSPRRYARATEPRQWQLRRVAHCLARYAVPRRVDQKGQVSVYNRNHYVGKKHHGQYVYVQFDPNESTWVFVSDRGNLLRQTPAAEISRARIVGLNVANRRPEPAQVHVGNMPAKLRVG
jgi:transposase InsO family protein